MPGPKSKSKSKAKSNSESNSAPKKEDVEAVKEVQKVEEVSKAAEIQEVKQPEPAASEEVAPKEELKNGSPAKEKEPSPKKDEEPAAKPEDPVVKPEDPVLKPEVETKNGSTTEADLSTEEKKEDSSATFNETDLKSVSEILKKLDLDNSDFDMEQKLNALCLIFKATVAENVRLRDSNTNLSDQMDKNEQTKVALSKLCTALRTQINLTKEEGELKVREETQKRIEVSENFQKTMDELGVLMSSHSTTNSKLKEENSLMSKQMRELLDQYEERQSRFDKLALEHKLQMELYEAKLNKAKLERAEMSTDFTRERLELHKSLVEAKEHIEILLKREENMLEQIDLYKKQTVELQSALTEAGTVPGAQNTNFVHFRGEIDKLTKRLRTMERDTTEWKEKFEASNDQVRKMNSITMAKEKEIEIVKKKLVAMENLNRVLSKERNQLLQQVKANNPADEKAS